MIALIGQLAFGQGAVEEPPAYEVTVIGEVAIRDARSRVVRAARDAGWEASDRGSTVVLHPPSSWMGRAKLTNDGDLLFGRPVLALAAVEAQAAYDPESNPNLSTPTGLTTGLPVESTGPYAPTASARFWFLPTRGRLDAAHERLLAAVDDELAAYNAIIRASRRAALPEPPVPPPRP